MPYIVSEQSILYKCDWSPLLGTTFSHSIDSVFVNGTLSYCRGEFGEVNAQRLQFEKDR